MSTDPQLDPATARSALDVADLAAASLTRQGRWLRRFLLLFAAASVVLVLVLGLGGRPGLFIGMGLWVVTISVAVPWANRQGAVPRGTGSLSAWTWASWAALYCGLLVVGLSTFPGRPAFWVPAALVTAVPFLVAAATTGRRPAGTGRVLA